MIRIVDEIDMLAPSPLRIYSLHLSQKVRNANLDGNGPLDCYPTINACFWRHP